MIFYSSHQAGSMLLGIWLKVLVIHQCVCVSVYSIMKPAVTLVATLVLGYFGSQTDAKADERYNARIIGGEEVTPAEQYVVRLLNPDTRAQCTGTQIKPQWVLTAANCNPGSVAEYFIVISGEDNGQQRNHTITQWINHKKYKNRKYWDNNIALVKVEPNIEATSDAVLPETEDADYINETGTAFGWGASCGFCTWSETLKKVDNLKIYSQEDCKAIYGKGPTNRTICAGNPDHLEGICNGDNGSPLMINNVIVGIASWMRYPCASLPAVYTKISHYIKWISRTTEP